MLQNCHKPHFTNALLGDAQAQNKCLNGGLGWLQVKCRRCATEASIPLEYVRQPRYTPIWKLEASLTCRSCRKDRYAPPVSMVKLTEKREIMPYPWCIGTRQDSFWSRACKNSE
jgi:hypothetical protein